jgi:putative hydrolase of the HAD superfamily
MPPQNNKDINNNSNNNTSFDYTKVTTLIFDVDDTLYDVGTGFTAHRNGEGAQSFMVSKLGFQTMEQAKVVRDEYFLRYHSTAKALTVAEEEGRFPGGTGTCTGTGTDNDNDGTNNNGTNNNNGSTPFNDNNRKFHTQDLAKWWATKLNFKLLGGKNQNIISILQSCPLNLIAFSNGPRMYVLRVLEEIGLLHTVFPPEKVFAVDDVMPYCKPEKKAFQIVLDRIGVTCPEECIMVEDSMKNTRVAKDLGMGTVLIAGLGRMQKHGTDANDNGTDANGNGTDKAQALADEAEATKAGDAPDITDDAVDVCIESVAELQAALPLHLWNK